jgi:fructose-1,6-bisphosphatase I
MNRLTLIEYIKEDYYKTAKEDILELMQIIQNVARVINNKLSSNGLIAESGSSGDINVYGEDVEKLDEYANKILTDAFLSCPKVFAVGSEELPVPKKSGYDGKFIITHDPLDGSSNIDTNLPIGTIFGIYPKNETILQKGINLICSGYILYGPSMMLVIATKNKVTAFTYDFKTQEFIMSRDNIKIGEKKIYSINEGNLDLFGDGDRNYLASIKKEGGYSLRYVGSMVADIHRTLLKGGIFIYPADSKHKEGKLRLLYEVAPLSFLIMVSGGMALSNNSNPLEIIPQKHDQRVPIVLGNKIEVEKYATFVKK